MSVTNRYDRGFVECIAHTTTEGRVHERTCADRADHDRCVRFVGKQNLTQVHVRVRVVQDPAAEDNRSRPATISSASRRESVLALTTRSTWCRRVVSCESRENAVMSTGND